jgi:hypothetical protein
LASVGGSVLLGIETVGFIGDLVGYEAAGVMFVVVFYTCEFEGGHQVWRNAINEGVGDNGSLV